ncbi:MerR family transcriptional regulator [Sphaerisporangium sp. NPDC051017]|uniref:MerR family transcriptional regulator n=1 Tax=Sphaerisporangium sp. NPDC051017 TaxID=3154636 RepID=UPI00343AEA00
MAWSTQQLADLAGTTVKSIRYYHRIGLLDEPQRADNGYKQYRTVHLVRLLQIRRLNDLGASLARIGELYDDDTDPGAAIRDLDAELEATIARLVSIRAELATIREHDAPLHSPAGFGRIAGRLSDSDQTLLLVLSRLLDDQALDDLRAVAEDQTPIDEEFDALPPDADDDAIRDLAARMAPEILRQQDRFPWLAIPGTVSPRGEEFLDDTMARVLGEIYSVAQLRVFVEVVARIEHLRAAREAAGSTRVEDHRTAPVP